MKKILSLALILVLSLSFTAFADASAFTCVGTSVANGATGVYAKEGTISITFSEAVDTVTVTMTKDTKAFNGFTATKRVSDPSIVDVVFDNDLAYNSVYSIDFSACKSATPRVVSGDLVAITFTVESAPEVEIAPAILMSGIGAGSITYPEALVADDTVQGWSIDINNKSAEDKDITVFCAIFDANGTLKKVVSSEKKVAALTTDSIGLGTVIPSYTDSGVSFSGGFAKLYVWNNVTDRSPYVAAQTFAIQ